jgi:hypothetical protein
VSSGERTPVYHVLEPGENTPVYHDLETGNKLNKAIKEQGDETYESLQPDSGPQSPIYLSLNTAKTNWPAFHVLAKETAEKLENISNNKPDSVTGHGLYDAHEANQEGFSPLAPREARLNETNRDFTAAPQISVEDDSDSLPLNYDYVCDIEKENDHVNSHQLSHGDDYLELVADNQINVDNVSRDSYDYVQDNGKETFSNPGQGDQDYLDLVPDDQNSDGINRDGINRDGQQDGNPDHYLELVEDDDKHEGYPESKFSNQNEGDDHSNAEYDYISSPHYIS